MSQPGKRFNQNKYDKLKKEFENKKKKIFNYEADRKLPTDSDERIERVNLYKTELVTAYNEYIKFVAEEFPTFDQDSKIRVREKVSLYKQYVLKALTILGLFLDLPNNFEEIDISKITTRIPSEELDNSEIFVRSATRANTDSQSSSSSTEEGATGGNSSLNVPVSNEKAFDGQDTPYRSQILIESNSNSRHTSPERPDTPLQGQSNNNSRHTSPERPNLVVNMAQNFEFFKNVGAIIKDSFDGDALQLEAFIAAIDLANDATEQAQKALLVKFIRTKLKGRAF